MNDEQETTHTQHAAAPKRPQLDLQAALEKLKVPGLHAQALLDGGRKDIEALLAANERVFTGIEALSHKQTDLLLAIMREWQAGAKDVIGKSSPAEKANHVSQHAQRAFSQALASMKDMADIAARSHEDVLTILNKRYQENLEAFRKSIRRQPPTQP